MSLGKYDKNNNEGADDSSESSKSTAGLYIERRLELGDEDDFLIIPNGGTGDCMFKAVSQAVFDGDESKHREIRVKVVDFIVTLKWEKFSEFIEVQHINGNSLLQRQWAKDPKQTYKMYMNLSGTLGSSSELTAAAELYKYNFATIQEYCNQDQRTYRVENCILFEDEPIDFHYFYFTGDFDNGHWEYIRNLSDVRTEDGTYHGHHKINIEGEDISIESWLSRETENRNAAEQLKTLTDRSLYAKRRSIYPFEMANCFRFQPDGTVRINGIHYTIENVQSTDLFSVLARDCMQNEGAGHELELVLIKHRYTYFEDINYKLITQPWSHNFTTEAIKYCSFPCKGNIQDLVCAADLYSFSFVMYIKLEDTFEETGEEVHQCKFTHVDRWGGENERILHFFMRLVPAGEDKELIARWWLLTPYTAEERLLKRKSKQRVGSSDSRTSTRSRSKQIIGEKATAHTSRSCMVINTVPVYDDADDGIEFQNGKNCIRTASRTSNNQADMPRPSRTTLSRTLTPRSMSTTKNLTGHFSNHSERLPDEDYQHFEHYPRSIIKTEVINHPPPPDQVEVPAISSSDDETRASIIQDFENIFGSSEAVDKDPKKPRSLPSSSSQKSQEVRLVKRKMRMDNMKPATGMDLVNHPERVRTVVRVKDKSSSNKEITFRGSGYMKADDVLRDLTSQGLIRLPSLRQSVHGNLALQMKAESSLDKIFHVSDENIEIRKMPDRDENFNEVQRERKGRMGPREENLNMIQKVSQRRMSERDENLNMIQKVSQRRMNERDENLNMIQKVSQRRMSEMDVNLNSMQREREKSAVSDISYENQGWMTEPLEPEPIKVQEKVIHQRRPTAKKQFSQTLISYINKDPVVKIKRNKVSPKSSKGVIEAPPQGKSNDPGYNTDDEGQPGPCLTGLVKLIARISYCFRRMSRAIRRGIRRRYERYHKSSVMFSFPDKGRSASCQTGQSTALQPS